jgi:hypothetical protein
MSKYSTCVSLTDQKKQQLVAVFFDNDVVYFSTKQG